MGPKLITERAQRAKPDTKGSACTVLTAGQSNRHNCFPFLQVRTQGLVRLSELPKASQLVTALSISDEGLIPMLTLLELEEREITGRKRRKQASARVHPRDVEDLNQGKESRT